VQQTAVSTDGSGLHMLAPGLYATVANAVNANGVAVGSVSPGSLQQRAVVFSGTREINLGTLPGDVASTATAINDRGVVVGTSYPPSGFISEPFVYAGGTLSGIPQVRNLGGFLGANAQGVNDSGAIVGSVGVSGFLGGATSSYVLKGTTLTLFATIHGIGATSQAMAINAGGTVTGYASTFGFSLNAPVHAYAWSGGVQTDLGTLYPNDEFANSAGAAINSQGVVVGYSQASRSGSTSHATAFANGVVTDLNGLLPANSGWLLENATGIDDRGNIVGVGLHNSIQRGFLLRTGSLFTK
jgi:probable HAF family extracellular repeat protein